MQTLQILLAVTDVLVLGVFFKVHNYILQTQTRLIIIEKHLKLI